MKRTLCVVLLFFTWLSFLEAKENLVFSWALVQKDTEEAPLEGVEISGEMQILPGKWFKFFFHPEKNAYIYLYYYNTHGQNSRGRLELCFPKKISSMEDKNFFGQSYFVPTQEDWFRHDNEPGEDYFYLLVSAEPLKNLEDLTNSYLKLKDKKGADLAELEDRILQEIRYQNLIHSSFSRPPALPKPYSGTLRSGLSVIEAFAKTIETEAFYGKTIRFDDN